MRDNRLAFGVSRHVLLSLWAGVSFYALSSVAYADEVVEEETTPAYKISSEIVAGAKKKTYLEESPYAERRRELEAHSTTPPVRRRPMRFGDGKKLPEMPSFEAKTQSWGDDSRITVGTAIPADEKSPMDEVGVISVPSQSPSAPAVEPAALVVPQAEMAVTTKPAPVENGKVAPVSFVDELFSFFGDEEESPAAAVALPRPAPATVPTQQKSLPKLGDPMKSVIIEKAPAGKSSIERTRDIVIPPEIRSDLQSMNREIAPIPPLMLTQERFKDDLTMLEPPVSALSSITQELEGGAETELASAMPQTLPQLGFAQEEEENLLVPEAPVDTLAQEEEPAPVAMAAAAPAELTQAEQSWLQKTRQPRPTVKTAKLQSAAENPLPWEKEEQASQLAPQPQELASQPAPEPETEIQPEVELASAQLSLPVKEEVVVQPLEGANAVKQHGHASVVVEEAKAVEISDDSKMMLKNFPAGLHAPKIEATREKVEISRASVPNLEINEPETKKHEALGISIEVTKPDLNANDYLVMAYEAMQKEQLGLAADYYRAILDSYPSNEDAMLGLATIHHRLGDKAEARHMYRRLLANSPRNEAVLNNFLVLVSEESPEKALQELLQLEAKNPYYDVIPAQLAAIYANQGQLEQAIGKMLRAIELNPEHLLYRYNLAVMLDHAGQRQQAIKAYSQVKHAMEKGDKIPTNLSYIQERLTFLLSNQPS